GGRGVGVGGGVRAGTGAMAAFLGLEDADVIAVCAEAASAGGVVEAVNFNSQGQVVIAGERAAVLRSIEMAKGRGAKRALELPVSVPSHSSLMKPAGEKLAQKLASIEIRAPSIRYLSAVDAREHRDAGDIRELLVGQLSSPVRWTTTTAALTAAGAKRI